jgi:hypothetical protein
MTFTALPSIKKIHWSVAVCGVFGALLIIFVIFPSVKEIRKNSQMTLSEKNKILSMSAEEENTKKAEVLYKSHQSDLDTIGNLLVNSEAPLEFINFLEKNANLCRIHLEISSMTKNTEKGGPWPSLSLQVLVVGSFSDFLKFLEKLENGPYLIEILGINTDLISEEKLMTGEFGKLSPTDTSTILSIKVFVR